MELIKVRVSDVLFEQLSIDKYRVFVGEKLVKETESPIEAQIRFNKEVERKLNKYINGKLIKQGISPIIGAIDGVRNNDSSRI